MTRLEQLEKLVVEICAELDQARDISNDHVAATAALRDDVDEQFRNVAEWLERERKRLNKLGRAHNKSVIQLSEPKQFAQGWSRRAAMAKATWAKRRPM